MSVDQYNEEVGKLYQSDPELFMFSPAFCRCEGQTHLYLHIAGGLPVRKSRFLELVLRFVAKILRDVTFSLLAQEVDLTVSSKQPIFVFSYFDERNNANGQLREEYFRGILDGNTDVYCFYKLINPGMLFRGARYLRLLTRLKKPFHGYAEYSFIDARLIFRAVLLTRSHLRKFKRHVFPDGSNPALVQHLTIAHLREISDGTVYYGYLQGLLFERLLAFKPRFVLFPWENHPWERILEFTKKKISPATISKGFQHTGFSKKLLQHFPSHADSGLATYPDYILCNGQVNRDELTRNPSISSKIIVAGALRQDAMLRKGVGKIADLQLQAGQPINVAFAFSWDQSTYEQILKDLERLPDNITVYLKFHPLYPDWLDRVDFPRRFVNSRASWAEIAATCPLILVNDNSLMFEGYYYGMHTAIYDGADEYGLEKRDFDSPIVHFGRDDLGSILTEEKIKRINRSTRQVLETNYLERYFQWREPDKLKAIFLDAIE